MKNELLALYTIRQKDFKKVVETFPEDDLAGPFLMSLNPDYYNSPNKLLIIGQETNGWSYHFDVLENPAPLDLQSCGNTDPLDLTR